MSRVPARRLKSGFRVPGAFTSRRRCCSQLNHHQQPRGSVQRLGLLLETRLLLEDSSIFVHIRYFDIPDLASMSSFILSTRHASPTVLRLSFSARNVYRRPPSQAGNPQYAALEPVSGPR